jgi:hypothetical protein
MTTKPPLQKILKRILHTEDEKKKHNKRTGSIKLMRRKDKHSESKIELSAPAQILKKQKQLNGRNHHTLLNINTKCQWTQLPHHKSPFGKLD